MKSVIVGILFASCSVVAHAQDSNHRPIWNEEKTKHNLAITNYALLAADIGTTKLAIDRGHKEANPILKPLFRAVGNNAGLSIDAILRALAIYHLEHSPAPSVTVNNIALSVDGVVTGLAIVNNLEALK